MATGGHRLWRMRKLHQVIDAELRDVQDGKLVSVDLLIKLNGTVSFSRRGLTRAEALEEAALRRAQLERDGWMEHW